jgi:hypothetical protein
MMSKGDLRGRDGNHGDLRSKTHVLYRGYTVILHIPFVYVFLE